MRPPRSDHDAKRPAGLTAVLGLLLAAGLFGGLWSGAAPTVDAPAWTLSAAEIAGVPAPTRASARRHAVRVARPHRRRRVALRCSRVFASRRDRSRPRADRLEPWRAAFIGRAPPR